MNNTCIINNNILPFFSVSIVIFAYLLGILTHQLFITKIYIGNHRSILRAPLY